MFKDNLIHLRKIKQLTQEDVADKVGVSRQAVAKWETGESSPDIVNCKALAELYHVSLDDLVNYTTDLPGFTVPPKGKHIFGMVKMGEKGQIVIPKKARDIFDIKPGDSLVILGDEEQGLAIIKASDIMNMMNNINTLISKPLEE